MTGDVYSYCIWQDERSRLQITGWKYSHQDNFKLWYLEMIATLMDIISDVLYLTMHVYISKDMFDPNHLSHLTGGYIWLPTSYRIQQITPNSALLFSADMLNNLSPGTLGRITFHGFPTERQWDLLWTESSLGNVVCRSLGLLYLWVPLKRKKWDELSC